MRTGINWWKWLFLILVGSLLGTGIWFTKTALMPVQIHSAPTTAMTTHDPVFTVQDSQNSAHRIMAHYLKTYLKDRQIQYADSLGTHEAALSGSLQFSGNAVKFQLTFDPLVLKNGDVLLKAQNLNIGALPVHNCFDLRVIGHSYKILKWDCSDSKAGTVVSKLSTFKHSNGMTLKDKQLDLTHDDLEFAVYLPDEE